MDRKSSLELTHTLLRSLLELPMDKTSLLISSGMLELSSLLWVLQNIAFVHSHGLTSHA
jgi:hypothetical protein